LQADYSDWLKRVVDDRAAKGYIRFPARMLLPFPEFSSPRRVLKAFMPSEHLRTVVLPATNAAGSALFGPDFRDVAVSEFWKWLGCWLAMSLCLADSRSEHWAVDESPLAPSLRLGRFGMTRDRFNDILRSFKLCEDDPDSADELTPIRAFIDAFNANMVRVFSPGWNVVVDESMSKWTSRHTLPNWMYVARKPTPMGQEWHDMADGSTNILFVLEPVESADRQKQKAYVREAGGSMAALLLRMTECAGLWHSGRVVVGDSAFGSVATLKALDSKGLFSVLVFKKHAYWPKHLPGAEMVAKVTSMEVGDVWSKQGTLGDAGFAVSCFRDMAPCFLLSNCCSDQPTGPQQRPVYKNAAGERVERFISRSDLFHTFYTTRHSVDDNNNVRQGARALEDAWQTRTWWHRSFCFFLGVAEANAFLAFKNFVDVDVAEPKSHVDFRRLLALQLLTDTDASEPQRVTRAGRRVPAASVHRLESIPAHSTWAGGQWVATLRGKYPQRLCIYCKSRTSHYCVCSPAESVCKSCFSGHCV
jgi:hypothetical protein